MGIYGELGRYPLYISRYARIIKFCCQIHDSDNILINTLNDSLLADCSRGVNNWASKLLDNYGFSYVWNNPFSVNLKTFHLLFKERVIDVFKQSKKTDSIKTQIADHLPFIKTSNSLLRLNIT